PQSPQNFFSGGLSAPHWAHRFAKAAPHSPQNFLPAGFSDPHLEHRIPSPLGAAGRPRADIYHNAENIDQYALAKYARSLAGSPQTMHLAGRAVLIQRNRAAGRLG